MGKRKKRKKNLLLHQMFSGNTFAGSIVSGLIVSALGFMTARLLELKDKD